MPEFHLDDRKNLGPRSIDYLSSCADSYPVMFVVVSTTSVLACVATCIIACHSWMALRRTTLCMQRECYRRLLTLPVGLALTSIPALASPRSFILVALIQMQWEAYALNTFCTLLFILLAHESICGEGRKVDMPEARFIGKRIISALAENGPKKHFTAPPLGCCFYPCCEEHYLSAEHLLRIAKLVRQYAVVAPMAAVVTMWAALALADRHFQLVHKVAEWTIKISALVCVYGLFVLYRGTHDLLEHWRTTQKFLSIKLMLVLSIYQGLIVDIFVQRGGSGECLHTEDELINLFNQWLTVLETVIMALMMARAFPASEITELQSFSRDLLLLDLEAIADDSGVVASSDTEESNDDDDDDTGDTTPLSPARRASGTPQSKQ